MQGTRSLSECKENWPMQSTYFHTLTPTSCTTAANKDKNSAGYVLAKHILHYHP